MRIAKVLLLFLLLMFNTAFSQEEEDKRRTFFDKLILRKSFDSKNNMSKAAVITYTNPKNNKESWLLSAAIGIDLLENTDKILLLNPYFEYHRNTLVDSEQNNWQTGLSFEMQTSDLSKPDRSWSPVILSSIKYNRDQENEISSFQGNLYFTPIFKGKALDPKFFWLPNTTVNFGNLFQFIYTPYVGLENENRFATETESAEGYIYRALIRITSNILLFPKSEKCRDKFEFATDWQYRYNFSENVEDLIFNDHRYFTVSFNYIFFSANEGKKSAKIGFDYTNGDNPAKNFEKQSFYAISLKLKL